MIAHTIERRNVDTGNGAGRLVQKVCAIVATFILHADIQTDDLRQHFLALANVEQIKEIRHGLGVIGTRSTTDDEGMLFPSLLGAKRNARERQHIEHCRVAHFVLQRKAEKIELTHRVATFQRAQRQVLTIHLLLHVHPRCEHALAPNVLVIVQRTVKDAHTEIRHADLVAVRKGKGKSRLDSRFIFNDLSILTARITTGLGNGFEQRAAIARVAGMMFSY